MAVWGREEKKDAEERMRGRERNPTCLKERWRGWMEEGWFQRRMKTKWG